jgi:hypothetical protein
MTRTMDKNDFSLMVLTVVIGMLPMLPTVAMGQVKINEIDISSAGAGKRMLLGDVTGDGRLDFVMMQGDQMADDRYIGHQVNCLTAFDFEGNQLWQVGNPSAGASTGSDIPAQIYDIDGDGENEVVACMDNNVISRKFVILDGKTGEVEDQFDYPGENAHDTILFANLSGNSYASDIILKDRYDNLWAMDNDWNLLFTHTGVLGHYPWASDYDGDGVEELMAGYDYLESNGDHLWSVNQGGHPDCIWVGDIDQDPSNGREIALGGDDITVYTRDGDLFARENMPVEPQNIAIGDFRPDLPGLEIGGQDRVDRGTPGQEAIFLWSPMQGKMLFYNLRSGWGSIANMVHNWDGTGSDFISIWRGPEPPALFDGFGDKVATFAEGYLMNGDVDGDGDTEVIIFTENLAILYSHSDMNLSDGITGTPRPQIKMQYNFTRYWGGEYPPFETVENGGDTDSGVTEDTEDGQNTEDSDATQLDSESETGAETGAPCQFECLEHCFSIGGTPVAGTCDIPDTRCCDLGTSTDTAGTGDTDADTGSDSDADSDTDSDVNGGTDGDADGDGDSDSDADTDSDGDSDTDSDTDSDSDADSDGFDNDNRDGEDGDTASCGCSVVGATPRSLFMLLGHLFSL